MCLRDSVNTLIFPNLSSANSAYKLLQAMDTDAKLIGPIQMGLNKPIHFTDFESSVRDIVNITAVAAVSYTHLAVYKRQAIFLYKGPYEHLQAVYDTIYGKYLPEMECRLRDESSAERYLNNPADTAPEELLTEIYIPVE